MKVSEKRSVCRMREFFRKNREDLIVGGVSFLLAVFFVLIFSISTSPIYRSDYYALGGTYDGGDSLHFQTDGVNWLNGKLPYRDGFDHKGPIIFLANALGWILGGGSRYGIMFFQIIALSVFIFFVWKISQLAKKSYLWGGISVVVTLIFVTACYAMGNSVQEYNLPFLAIATYFLVKYFYQDKLGKHHPKYAFAYGMAFGASLLLQATNMIAICAGVLVILVILVKEKEWKNLWQNILMGLAGILVLWVPFALYFLLNGAFGEFVYCTLLFNFSYADKIGSWLHGANGFVVRNFITVYLPFFCAIVAAALAFVRGKKAYAAMLGVSFLLEAYFFLSGTAFYHYVLPCIFQIGLLLNEIILFKHKDTACDVAYVGMVGVIAMLTYDQMVNRASTLMDDYNAVGAASVNGIGYEQLMDKYANEIHKQSFTAFGDMSLKGIYVRYGIIPYNKFFMIQNWCASFTDEIDAETREDLSENHAEYFLVDERFVEESELGIREILKEHYSLLDRDGDYSMYKLKNEG